MASYELSSQKIPGSNDEFFYRDDVSREAIAAADGNLADEYSASQSYAVGDWCIHNHALYQCTAAVNAYTFAYIVGNTTFGSDWLSLTADGSAISQFIGTANATIYKVATAGDYFGKYYQWDEVEGEYSEVELSEAWNNAKWTRSTLTDKIGTKVVVTADDTTPPSDTSVLWVYPES